LPLLWLALAAATGCSAHRYQAATLPEELRAPKTIPNEINLGSASSMGTGSSIIGPGDLLAVTISTGSEQKKVEPMLARVDEDGTVNVPLIGLVPISDIDPIEAADRIAATSVERNIYRQPAVVVKIEEPAVNRVTVLGAVNKPGVQKLPRGASNVLNAIAAAEGFTEEASTEIEVMRRQGSPTFFSSKPKKDGVVTASYSDSFAPPPITPLDGAAPAASDLQSYRIDLAQANSQRPNDYQVGDGDMVMVHPDKERVIHVSGLVHDPDQFKIPKGQDVYVLDAIAMAGGIKSPVADKVIVIRRLENMREPAVIAVSIAKAKKDGSENLRLAAGDLVSVESTMLTNTVDTLTTFFRMSLGIGGSFATF
jgi:polysaccharide export outer membrane protein